MGGGFMNVLEGFEQLAYRILIWIILIPKTIVKVILNPGFAHKYVHDEIEHDKESPFDEYMSPVLLYLGITLLPALAIYFMPVLDTVSIISPVETTTMSRNVEFKAEADFRGDTSVEYHTFKWVVSKCTSVDNADMCQYDFLAGELHSEENGWAKLTSETEENPKFTENLDSLEIIDRNTVDDTFDYEFQPGNYRISFSGANSFENNAGEIYVFVPDNQAERVQIYSNYQRKKDDDQNWDKLFSSGTTIFIGLALLIPPLIFALAGNIFHPAKKKLSETELKEDFYTQCYYFVPLGLTAWAWYYSEYFYSSDISIPESTFALPFWAALIWFVVVEARAIARERHMKSAWRAVPILFVCIVAILVLAFVVLSFIFDLNTLRKSAIWFYPCASGLLVLSAVVLVIRKWLADRRARNQAEARSDHLPLEP